MLIKPLIFGLFGDFEKEIDSYKDVNNKGVVERTQEAVGEDFDSELGPLLDQLVNFNVEPYLALDTMFPYIEADYGNVGLLPAAPLAIRRVSQRHITKYYSIRGTKRCYELLFNLLGFDAEITEYFSIYSFDSPVTFDDDVRVFDLGKCAGCTGYSINLIRFTDTGPLTDEELDAITRIIKFNEPINARLVSLSLDGDTIGDFNLDYNYDFLA